jgi:hypothetical protein
LPERRIKQLDPRVPAKDATPFEQSVIEIVHRFAKEKELEALLHASKNILLVPQVM